MRLRLDECSPALKKRIEDAIRNQDNPSHIPSKLECDTGNAPVEKKKVARYNAPVGIHFHCTRKRLIDVDNYSAKGIIDGFVKAGILQDDGPEFVRAVTFSQEKGEPEKTVIIIKEIQ